MSKLPNHIEIEYAMLAALKDYHEVMTVSKQYGDTVYSIPLANGTERAVIKVDIVQVKYCTKCMLEMINPNYSQKVHEKCPINPKLMESEPFDPDADKPGLDIVINSEGLPDLKITHKYDNQ